MTDVQCKKCNIVFSAKISEIKKGYSKFCSRKCYDDFRKKEPNVECAYCKDKFYKNPSKMKMSKSGLFFLLQRTQVQSPKNWRNKRNTTFSLWD